MLTNLANFYLGLLAKDRHDSGGHNHPAEYHHVCFYQRLYSKQRCWKPVPFPEYRIVFRGTVDSLSRLVYRYYGDFSSNYFQ